MSREDVIRSLLAAAGRAAGEEAGAEARVEARVAWVHQRIADLKAADKRVFEAWDRILDALPEDIDDEELEAIPDPPEQAERDAIFAEIEAVRDHDRWPKHLHWSS
jgi:hypothetical protein